MKKRTILVIGIVFGVLVSVVVGWIAYDQLRVRTVRVGSGEKGGSAYVAVEALGQIVAKRNRRIQVIAVATAGSAENMELLQKGELDMVIVQNDVPPIPEARTVAFLYPQLFHLVARNDSGIESVADLKGKRVGTPLVGTGSQKSFLVLMEHYGLTDADMTVENVASDVLVQKFLSGELDAIFRNDVLGDARLTQALKGGDGHIVPIDQAEAMRFNRPYLEGFNIPKGFYRADPPVPAEALPTVGVQTALLANAELDATITREVTQALFDHRLELAQAASEMGQLLSPFDAGSLSMAVHQGAEAYYNREQPSFLEEHADYIGLLITFAGLGASAYFSVRAKMRYGSKNRVEEYTQQVMDLVDACARMTQRSELEEAERKLLDYFKQVMADVAADRIPAESVGSFSSVFDVAMATVRHRMLVTQ